MSEQDVTDTGANVVRWMETTNRNIGKLARIAELQNQHLSHIRSMVALTLGVGVGTAMTIAIAILR